MSLTQPLSNLLPTPYQQSDLFNALAAGQVRGAPSGLPDRVLTTSVSQVVFYPGQSSAAGQVVKVKLARANGAPDSPWYDGRAIEARRFFCENEFKLNDPTAPGVYQKIQPVWRLPDGSFEIAVESAGEIVDHGLFMQRLPDAANLAFALEAGQDVGDHMPEIISVIADMQASARVVYAPDEAELYFERFLETYGGNASELDAAIETINQRRTEKGWLPDSLKNQALPRINAYDRFMASAADLASEIKGRCHDGFVRECHGDLHLGNLWRHEGQIKLMDAIEFNDVFRQRDGAHDVSYLSASLMLDDHAKLAQNILRLFRSQTGQMITSELFSLFMADRLFVKGFVGLLEAENRTGQERTESMLKVFKAIDLADQMLRSVESQLDLDAF